MFCNALTTFKTNFKKIYNRPEISSSNILHPENVQIKIYFLWETFCSMHIAKRNLKLQTRWISLKPAIFCANILFVGHSNWKLPGWTKRSSWTFDIFCFCFLTPEKSLERIFAKNLVIFLTKISFLCFFQKNFCTFPICI